MEKYFKKLQTIGVAAIRDLRNMDAQHTEMQKSYYDDFRSGNLTAQGYQSLVKTLDDTRARKEAEIKAQIEGVKAEYKTAVAALLMPSTGKMHLDDIEILKSFDLSPAEFESMAKKYDDNPTMARLLNAYKTEHEGRTIAKENTTGLVGSTKEIPWHTDWYFQTEDERNAIFNSACNSVESIIRQTDKYSPDREGSVAKRISDAYHKTQGSKADEMTVDNGQAQPQKSYTFF